MLVPSKGFVVEVTDQFRLDDFKEGGYVKVSWGKQAVMPDMHDLSFKVSVCAVA